MARRIPNNKRQARQVVQVELAPDYPETNSVLQFQLEQRAMGRVVCGLNYPQMRGSGLRPAPPINPVRVGVNTSMFAQPKQKKKQRRIF